VSSDRRAAAGGEIDSAVLATTEQSPADTLKTPIAARSLAGGGSWPMRRWRVRIPDFGEREAEKEEEEAGRQEQEREA
jgi:hypothetical protein